MVISFDSKGRSATFSSDNVSIIVDGAISESKLVLKNGPTGLPYYEVGVPTARGTAFIAKFPDIMIGNGVVAIPQVNYTFISRVVLKCLNT